MHLSRTSIVKKDIGIDHSGWIESEFIRSMRGILSGCKYHDNAYTAPESRSESVVTSL